MPGTMKQLTGLDATFLHLETPQMPMHVGALHVFELPAGHTGKFVTRLRAHIAARLPAAPVLRRRLWWMPLNLANPAMDITPVVITALNARIQTLTFERERLDPTPAAAQAPR